MSRVLVVDDSRVDQRLVTGLVEDRTDLIVEVACDGLDALERVEAKLPQLILTDMQMPRMDGLELVKRVRKDYPSVPIILMTAFGNEELAAEALCWGASGYVPKTHLAKYLIPSIERILALLDDQVEQKLTLDCLSRSQWEFRLDNDPEQCQSVLRFLRAEINRLRFLDETQLMQLGVAIDEALNNAIHHGNLELDTDLRNSNQDRYLEMFEQRRQTTPFAARRVDFRISVGPSEAKFVIRDEGEGFDTSKLPKPNDVDQLAQMSGRGLVLIRSFMDSVKYNKRGNEVTLIKRIQTPAVPSLV